MEEESLNMHSQRVESLSQAQRERLAYIDFRLYYMGEVGRPDLTSRFGLAPAALSQPDLCSQGQKGHQRLQKGGWSARGLAELTVFYCEEVFDFLAGCGMDDDGFYDALVRMFEQALKYVLDLPKAQQKAFLARLDRVRQLGQDVGWGVGDDFDHIWSEAGLEGDE
jgi:hypothetical protein